MLTQSTMTTQEDRLQQCLRNAARLAALAVAVLATSAEAQRSAREDRCFELERQLVSDWQRAGNPRDAIAQIDEQIRQHDRVFRRSEVEADRRNCYDDYFIFGRSLKRTPQCLKLDREIETARRQLAQLREQREQLTRSSSRRARQDDLIAELARYGCGATYERQYQARRRSESFFSLWEDDDEPVGSDDYYGRREQQQNELPFATYRTMCVRLCDGYYFPISYSTLQSRLRDDEAKCQEQCAAPSELFIYRNPGEEVEQMVSLSGRPYNDLPNAWRHRKHYIRGCSCKPEEYSAQSIAESEQEISRRAEAGTKGDGPARRQPAVPVDEPPAQDADSEAQPSE